MCLTKEIRDLLNAHFQRKVRSYRNTATGLSCKFIILTPANIKKKKKNTPLGKLFHPHCLAVVFPFTENDTLFLLATVIVEASLKCEHN